MRKLLFGTTALVLHLCGAGGFQAAAATCTVPNAISNGQVADATKVMDNFDAVVDCVNDAPAGSTDSIQVKGATGFSGVGPLTEGQLLIGKTGAPPQALGPLTDGQLLVGSTGGLPQATTITAGSGVTIVNGAGSITIGATSGSGSGGIYDISMGVPTTFTNVNIGGNSSVVTNGSKAITVKAGASTPTSPTLYGVAVPVPTTTPYMVAVLALANFAPVRYSGVSIGFYDSTTSKLVTLTSAMGSGFGFAGYSFSNWASATSRASISEPGVPRSTNYGPTWFGIKDNGTTISFHMSIDGANYYPLPFTQTKSGGYLSAYDHIFIGMFNDAEGGSEGSANNNVSVTYLAYDPNGLTRLAGP